MSFPKIQIDHAHCFLDCRRKQILKGVLEYLVVENLIEMPFSFRMKIGQQEIEISGTREEVIETIEMLPSLVANISEAFESTEHTRIVSRPVTSTYPSISSSSCSEAVLELLETDWGKQARTLTELGKVLKANTLNYPSTTLSGVLAWLVRKNKIKRWKTDKGYVYVLAGG